MSEPHERLDRAMKARGLELKKKWVQVAREAGVTVSALGAIRRGEYKPSPHTALSLDEVYQWPPGTVSAILADEELPTGKVSPLLPRAEDSPATAGEAIEAARERRGMSISEAAAGTEVAAEDWERLSRLRTHPTGRDILLLSQMAHAAGLDHEDMEPVDEDVAYRMRKTEVNRAWRQMDDDQGEADRMLSEAEEKLRRLNKRGLRAVNQVLDTIIEGDGTA